MSSTFATAHRRVPGAFPSFGASSAETNEIASLPSTSPLGATRKKELPPPSGDDEPTAPVSQNRSPRRAASAAAGSEIVLP